MVTETNTVNDVNDATRQSVNSVAFGRRGHKASSVVNQRNPFSDNTTMKTLMQVGTWNVRTLGLLKTGKLANVTQEMKRAKISILGLSEVRWKEGGDFFSDGVRVIYAGGTESQRGVAILLDEGAAKSVISTVALDDRIIMVKLNVNRLTLLLHRCTCQQHHMMMKKWRKCMINFKT